MPITQVLVRWKHSNVEDSTWEDLIAIYQQFPTFSTIVVASNTILSDKDAFVFSFPPTLSIGGTYCYELMAIPNQKSVRLEERGTVTIVKAIDNKLFVYNSF